MTVDKYNYMDKGELRNRIHDLEARVKELERMEEHWHNRALLAEVEISGCGHHPLFTRQRPMTGADTFLTGYRDGFSKRERETKP